MTETTTLPGMKLVNESLAKPKIRFPALRSLFRRKLALIGVLVLLVVVVAGVFAPNLAPYDPIKTNMLDRLKPPGWTSASGEKHILGTDVIGRDVLSRLIYGTRVSLVVGITAVAIAGTIGVLFGLLSGYYGGWLDTLIMRIADIQFAFPFILLAMAVLAVLGSGVFKLILVLGFNGWVRYGRITRSQVLSLREQEFVLAARSIGMSHSRILFKHILPNLWGPVIVIASFMVASTIIAEASLSFLGLGVPPMVPTWGGMLAVGRDYLTVAPWLSIYAGVAISIVVLSINIVGDWVRDYLDPNLKNLA